MSRNERQRARSPRATRAITGVAVTMAAAALWSPGLSLAEPRAHHDDLHTARSDLQTADTAGTGDDAVRPERLLDACPLDGSATFEDSWGWARSGGRRHEGVDMIAERGTPVIAVRTGDAHFKHNRLGGLAVWLTAENGDKFYYAHLDSFEGESRSVAAGEVIGYVGSSGNAKGPHLHFETLPGGNVENPYAHTFGACVPALDVVLGATDGPVADALDDATATTDAAIDAAIDTTIDTAAATSADTAATSDLGFTGQIAADVDASASTPLVELSPSGTLTITSVVTPGL